MNLSSRRKFLLTAGASAAALALPTQAQALPSLRIVVGFPPGGTSDVLARAVAERLRGAGYASLVLVDNKPGAASRIAIEHVKAAAPDGQTALLTPMSGLTLYPHVYKTLRYDPEHDLLPVTALSRTDMAVFAGPGLPASVGTLAELAQWARSHPGQANFGSPAVGSSPHLTGQIFAQQSGSAWQAVGYPGAAPGIAALLGGQIPVYFGSISDGLEHVRAGKLRALATTGQVRSPYLAQVATCVEQGFPSLVVQDHHSILLPRGTPAELVQRFHAAAVAVVADPSFRGLLDRFALDPVGNTPAELAAIRRTATERWGTLVKSIGYVPE